MEAAATLTWRTHYINLTPMYFNKAEGCYKYTQCYRVLISPQETSKLLIVLKLYYK